MRPAAVVILPALFILPTLGLPSRNAHAKECDPGISTHLRNAIDVQRTLRDYDALLKSAHIIEVDRDRVLPKRDFVTLRATALTSIQSHFISGSGCDDGEVLNAGAGRAGLLLTIEDITNHFKLTFLGVGNRSSAQLQDDELSGFASYGGIAGVRAEITYWLLVGVARFAATYSGEVAPGNTLSDDGYVVEVGIPRLAVLARFLISEDAVEIVPDLQLRNIPLGKGVTGAIVIRKTIGERRRIVNSTASYEIRGGHEMALDLDAEIAVESAPRNLRHARIRLRNLLMESESWSSSMLSIRIEQHAALSIHRGNLMQSVSQVGTAVGAEFQFMTSMNSEYFSYRFLCGFSGNKPELLDIVPHAANQFEARVGMEFGHRW